MKTLTKNSDELDARRQDWSIIADNIWVLKEEREAFAVIWDKIG